MVWGGSKLLPEKCLEALRFSVNIETVFSAQIEAFSKKKKKRSSLKFERFFCPNEGVLQKKKKVFTETETVFWQWCAQISTLFAQINRPFARIFDVLNRMGGRPPPLPPRLLRLWFSNTINGAVFLSCVATKIIRKQNNNLKQHTILYNFKSF